MNGTSPRSQPERITALINYYYDLGIRYVWSIHQHIIANVATEDWHELYDPSGSYANHDYPEEDIIRYELNKARKTEFVYRESDLETLIGQFWEHGMRDVLEITGQVIEHQRQCNQASGVIDVELVRSVLRRMGHVV